MDGEMSADAPPVPALADAEMSADAPSVPQPLAWLKAACRDLSDVWTRPSYTTQAHSQDSASVVTEAVGVAELPGTQVVDVEELLPASSNASSSCAPAGSPEVGEASSSAQPSVAPAEAPSPLRNTVLQRSRTPSPPNTPKRIPKEYAGSTPPLVGDAEEELADDAEIAEDVQFISSAGVVGQPQVVLGAPCCIDYEQNLPVS